MRLTQVSSRIIDTDMIERKGHAAVLAIQQNLAPMPAGSFVWNDIELPEVKDGPFNATTRHEERIGCGGSCHTAKLVRHPECPMGLTDYKSVGCGGHFGILEGRANLELNTGNAYHPIEGCSQTDMEFFHLLCTGGVCHA